MNGSVFAFPWEVSLITFLQAHLGAVGEGLAVFFTLFGEQLMVVLLLGFLYWSYDKELARRVGTAALAAALWCVMLKNAFLRLRPYMAHDEVICIRPAEKGDVNDVLVQGYSFPSGHTTLASAAFWSLTGERRWRGWLRLLCGVMPLLVAVSRFCLGVHYPTDVLAGLLCGAAGMVTVRLLDRFVKHQAVYHAILAVMVLPGLFFCKSDDYFTLLGTFGGYLLGTLFEKRLVNFEGTRVWWRALLRVLGGALVYFGLNTLLKLPFDAAFLASGTLPAHLVRLARYVITVFAAIGLYPMVFSRSVMLLSEKDKAD